MGGMVAFVTYHVPPTVKTIFVTYKVDYVLSVDLGYIAVTVIYHVPRIVKTTYATIIMEPA